MILLLHTNLHRFEFWHGRQILARQGVDDVDMDIRTTSNGTEERAKCMIMLLDTPILNNASFMASTSQLLGVFSYLALSFDVVSRDPNADQRHIQLDFLASTKTQIAFAGKDRDWCTTPCPPPPHFLPDPLPPRRKRCRIICTSMWHRQMDLRIPPRARNAIKSTHSILQRSCDDSGWLHARRSRVARPLTSPGIV